MFLPKCLTEHSESSLNFMLKAYAIKYYSCTTFIYWQLTESLSQNFVILASTIIVVSIPCIFSVLSSGKQPSKEVAKYSTKIRTTKMAIIAVLEGLRILRSINSRLRSSFYLMNTKRRLQKDKIVFSSSFIMLFIFNCILCMEQNYKLNIIIILFSKS